MSRQHTILKNTDFACRAEVTENTAPADSATGAEVLLRTDAVAWNLSREVLEDNYMTSTLSKAPPQIGMFSDIGVTLPVYLRGSGTQGTAPDYAPLMKVIMGDQFDGTVDAVLASPTPTTVGATVTAGTRFTIGGIVRIAIGAGWEYRRITNIATNALTWFPATSAAPATGAAVQPGNAFLLKSAVADHGSVSNYFYFEGGKKLIYSGCKGNMAIALAVGQRATCDFTMQALSYAVSDADIGYTAAYNTTTKPPICLEITMEVLYAATVGAGATTASIPLVSTPDLQLATYGSTTPYSTSKLIVDVGAGVYETKTITSFVQATQTATVAALTGAPAEGQTAYVQVSECIPAMNINLEYEIIKDECMRSASGADRQFYANRSLGVEFPDRKFTDIFPIEARDNVTSVEVWATLGDAAGNIISMCIPKYYRTELDLGAGDFLMTLGETGMGALTSADDEFLITHL